MSDTPEQIGEFLREYSLFCTIWKNTVPQEFHDPETRRTLFCVWRKDLRGEAVGKMRNGGATVPATVPATATQLTAAPPAAPAADPSVCPIHNAKMKQYSNNKGTWYSHKLADGTWCNGKAKAGK